MEVVKKIISKLLIIWIFYKHKHSMRLCKHHCDSILNLFCSHIHPLQGWRTEPNARLWEKCEVQINKWQTEKEHYWERLSWEQYERKDNEQDQGENSKL